MILIIDNYDSFTFNLVQCIGELGYSAKAVRSDKMYLQDIQCLNPSHIIISPGPGRPQEAGISLKIIPQFAASIPILGVCLGHQSIGYIYGATIEKLEKPMHGKISRIYHEQAELFNSIPSPFQATHYHSLIINRSNLPKLLKVTAQTNEGIIMACQHSKYSNVQGVQFHPESLWTEHGRQIIKNFLLTKST